MVGLAQPWCGTHFFARQKTFQNCGFARWRVVQVRRKTGETPAWNSIHQHERARSPPKRGVDAAKGSAVAGKRSETACNGRKKADFATMKPMFEHRKSAKRGRLRSATPSRNRKQAFKNVGDVNSLWIHAKFTKPKCASHSPGTRVPKLYRVCVRVERGAGG